MVRIPPKNVTNITFSKSPESLTPRYAEAVQTIKVISTHLFQAFPRLALHAFDLTQMMRSLRIVARCHGPRLVLKVEESFSQPKQSRGIHSLAGPFPVHVHVRETPGNKTFWEFWGNLRLLLGIEGLDDLRLLVAVLLAFGQGRLLDGKALVVVLHGLMRDFDFADRPRCKPGPRPSLCPRPFPMSQLR